MGKIFDALEKASRQTRRKEPSLSAKNKGKGGDRLTKGNVVPFTDLLNQKQDQCPDPNLVAFYNPQSIEAELFKVLRTNLLFPANGRPPKSIMVTSAGPGEGKSLVSANLAVSIAKGIEEHVLLIDSDLRKPSIDNYFGIVQAEGLSEYLTIGRDVSRYFTKSPVEKLTILTAGEPPANPTELLTTQKMKVLLDEVSQRYADRYIIIDSAPPAVASETAAVAKYVDGIIIVVRAGKTPRHAISEVIEQLGKEKILGIVLNHSDQNMKKYYGYGKYYNRSKSK